MKKLVIANRGEIARRILHAGKMRGFLVAVIATTEDSDSLVCQESDDVLIVSSFLNAKEIINISLKWGACLLHPGYGFLSENAEFADLVEKSGILFVGPTPENMRCMGSKEAAKNRAHKCNVPTLNALLSCDLKRIPHEKWESEFAKKQIFSPYLVKASGGGGGRGMRVVTHFSELKNAIARASEEALAAFNDGTVFVERYLESPRHIEVQVVGDGLGGGVFFGERECSLQRRHQKVIEEAPSCVITKSLREQLGLSSLSLVKETKYRGAGTLEFLMDDNNNFYFLEMNTRLQVEHPVTELAFGVDLVQAQFDIALGKWPDTFPSPNEFVVLEPKCVALEARILAEDPRNNFLPTPGNIAVYHEPHGAGVRIDSGVVQGTRVNSNFDSMIAKLIVHAPTRSEAVHKLKKALEEFIILGTTTNIPFLKAIASHHDFLQGRESTAWIAEHLEKLNENKLPNEFKLFVASQGFREKLSFKLNDNVAPHSLTFESSQSGVNQIFARQKNWLSPITKNDLDHFELHKLSQNKYILSGKLIHNIFANNFKYVKEFSENSRIPFYATKKSVSQIHMNVFGEIFILECPNHVVQKAKGSTSCSNEIKAPMAGKVIEVFVTQDENVTENQVLFIVESMKMQLEVKAPRSGKITQIFIEKNQILPGPEVMAHVD